MCIHGSGKGHFFIKLPTATFGNPLIISRSVNAVKQVYNVDYFFVPTHFVNLIPQRVCNYCTAVVYLKINLNINVITVFY